MPSVRNAVYRSLLRTVSKFHLSGIPCLGVAQSTHPEHPEPSASNHANVTTDGTQQHEAIVAPWDARSRVRMAFRSPPHATPSSGRGTSQLGPAPQDLSSLDVALRALRRLQAQLAVLHGSEHEARAALLEWHALLLQSGPPALPLAVAPAAQALRLAQHAEAAALTLFRISRAASEADGGGADGDASLLLGLEPDTSDEPGSGSHSTQDTDDDVSAPGSEASAAAALDAIAGDVRRALETAAATATDAPHLQPHQPRARSLATVASTSASSGLPAVPLPSPTSSSSSPNCSSSSSFPSSSGSDHPHERAVHAVSAALLQGRSRLKNDAVEWVYDGLAPLLLPQVLRKHKGVPLMLALAFCSVAQRLGVPAVPFCTAAPDGGPNANPLGLMPLELMAKQAGRAVVAAPAPDEWMVACPALASPDPCEGATPETASVTAQEGRNRLALDGEGTLFVDVCRRGRVLGWRELESEMPEAARQARAWGQAGPLPALSGLCAALARTAMTAHQRRGESDLVVHYLYQLLALDPGTPEWQRALQRAEVAEGRQRAQAG